MFIYAVFLSCIVIYDFNSDYWETNLTSGDFFPEGEYEYYEFVRGRDVWTGSSTYNMQIFVTAGKSKRGI